MRSDQKSWLNVVPDVKVTDIDSTIFPNNCTTHTRNHSLCPSRIFSNLDNHLCTSHLPTLLHLPRPQQTLHSLPLDTILPDLHLPTFKQLHNHGDKLVQSLVQLRSIRSANRTKQDWGRYEGRVGGKRVPVIRCRIAARTRCRGGKGGEDRSCEIVVYRDRVKD